MRVGVVTVKIAFYPELDTPDKIVDGLNDILGDPDSWNTVMDWTYSERVIEHVSVEHGLFLGIPIPKIEWIDVEEPYEEGSAFEKGE